MLQDNAKSCAILKGSPSETKGVSDKFLNNNGFIMLLFYIK